MDYTKQREATPERSIGEGEDALFVCFWQNSKTLAKYQGKGVWPCRLCDPDDIGEMLTVDYPEKLCVPFVIKMNDGDFLNEVLGCFMRLGGVESIGMYGAGAGWLLTNPEMIERAYEKFVEAASAFKATE